MLHMLSPEVMNLPTSAGTTWEELRPKAIEWVRSEAKRFSDERNYKLWARYGRLLAYFAAYPPPRLTTDSRS
jgi:hypothetical protein